MSKSSDDQIRALLKSLNGDVSAVTEHLVSASASIYRGRIQELTDEFDKLNEELSDLSDKMTKVEIRGGDTAALRQQERILQKERERVLDERDRLEQKSRFQPYEPGNHKIRASAPGARTALEAELDDSDRPASAARTSLETDDVGDAPEGEVSVETMGILRALAETPLGRPGLINVMMNLDPASLNSLCRTSRDFEHICADPVFRVPYEQKWYVTVRFAGLTGAAHNVRLMKTRTAGDAKRALAQASGSPYNYINIIFNGTVPTAQSSLDGMIKAATAAGLSVTPLVMPFTRRLGGQPYDYATTSRHYMPDGTNFDVSRD